MDKLKGLSPNHVFVQKSRWPYSMQNKFAASPQNTGESLVGVVICIIRIYSLSKYISLHPKKARTTCRLKASDAYLNKKNILWMKTNYYPYKITSHLVTTVPMTSFTLKSTSKLRSFLDFKYSIVIPRFIPHANKAQF